MARIQPQGAARLDRRNKFAANAHAILLASQNVNLASGKPLTAAGSGYLKRGFPAGQAWSFRKNFYIETEVLPAIGTASYVEFWFGYPSTDLYASGSIGQDPGFLTGSSTAQLGIFGSKGSRYGSGDGSTAHWGMVNVWDSQLDSAGEALTPGELTLLIGVRRQTGIELWRNGRMIRFVAHASPSSKPASSLICGSFIQDASYWTSSSDTVMAGRVPTPVEPTAEEIKQFSANVWQQFLTAHEEDDAAAAAVPANTQVNPGLTALTLTGFAPTVARGITTNVGPSAATLSVNGFAPSITQGVTKTISPAPASMAITGYAPDVSQTSARTTNPAPAALAIAGYAPTVTRGASLNIAAGAPAGVTLTGYAPTVTQANNVAPHMYDATIMRLSSVRSVTDLGPDRIQQTASLI